MDMAERLSGINSALLLAWFTTRSTIHLLDLKFIYNLKIWMEYTME